MDLPRFWPRDVATFQRDRSGTGVLRPEGLRSFPIGRGHSHRHLVLADGCEPHRQSLRVKVNCAPVRQSAGFRLRGRREMAYFGTVESFELNIMTNPTQAIRMLVTYAICIPLAIFMGYLMTEIGNNPDYSNMFMVAVVLAVLVSPIF